MRVVAWNVETFGSRYSRFKVGPLANGFNIMQGAQNELVASTIADSGAQVVVLQELRKSGVPFLQTIRALLGDYTGLKWNFDWIPGALRTLPKFGSDVDFRNYGFSQAGNSEGYAVLFTGECVNPSNPAYQSAGVNNADPNTATGSASKNLGTGAIALILQGRHFDIENDALVPTTHSYKDLGFPFSSAPKIGTVYMKHHLDDPNDPPYVKSNDFILNTLNARRPSYVSLAPRQSGDSGPPTADYVVYHAPVGDPACLYGAMTALLSKQLDYGDTRIYGGDFNLASTANHLAFNQLAKSKFYEYDQTTIDDNGGSPGTIVNYVKNGTWAAGDNTYTTPRDYMLGINQEANVTLGRYDALASITGSAGNSRLHRYVTDNDIALRGTILPTFSELNKFITNNETPLTVCQRFLQNWQSTKTAGGADAKTAAAIIFRTLVSDHCPMIAEISA